jgi:hypothetical protein
MLLRSPLLLLAHMLASLRLILVLSLLLLVLLPLPHPQRTPPCLFHSTLLLSL